MDKPYLEVYPSGTPVKIANTIDATITGMLIRGTHIQYECQWATDKLKAEWVDASLLSVSCNNEKQKIGFGKE